MVQYSLPMYCVELIGGSITNNYILPSYPTCYVLPSSLPEQNRDASWNCQFLIISSPLRNKRQRAPAVAIWSSNKEEISRRPKTNFCEASATRAMYINIYMYAMTDVVKNNVVKNRYCQHRSTSHSLGPTF